MKRITLAPIPFGWSWTVPYAGIFGFDTFGRGTLADHTLIIKHACRRCRPDATP